MTTVFNNITAFKNITTVPDLWAAAETASNGTMTMSFVLIIFMVIFYLTKGFGIDKALISASFPCFMLGLYLSFAGVLNLLFPLSFLAIMGFTYLFMVTISSKN